ncbi:tetratricopeptide repeat protein [Plebeiibacterium sediminum]|uniref:Tetratricopeptide repeat protein n=1 Tax=Plebeiibacterium sediminum TaxID=2992112 RepID=A0AAE3M0X1_9BACT|nr:tetratricopeptide repeat protein [Plebeiobacterium sediminum]MCW3785174.1 tetratricopeptide repeat protein [Plebeiobacterium sediminum]
MKYYYIIGLLSIVLFSCKTLQNTPSKSIKSDTVLTTTSLNSVEKRKFDYFFYESQRLKMQGQIDKAKMYLIECIKIDSLSSTCYYELSNIEIGYKNYKGAQDLLKNAVRLAPNNKWYKMLLGDLYQQNKDIPNSIVMYKSLTEQFQENEEYLYVLAQLYAQNQEYQNAIDTYDCLEGKIGITEIITLEKEKLYLQLGKESLAYKEVQNLIKDNPYEPKYYGYLGDVYFYNKEYDKAKDSYNKIFTLDPGNGLGYFSLGNIAINEKDTVLFLTNYTKALQDKNLDVEIKIQRLLPFLVGQDFNNYKDTASVEALFIELTKTHNEDAKAFVFYGNYLQNRSRIKEAISYYKIGLKLDNTNASVWQDLFLLEINNGDFTLLYNDTKEALISFPEEPLFFLFHGMACMQKELNEEAYNSFIKGLEFVGDNKQMTVQFYANLGDVLYNLKRSDESFTYYDKALKIDENNVVVLNNYSYYLSLENKNLDKAESMIAKCIELEPSNSTYLDTYAWVLFKRGRYFEAKYIIERAIDNGGNSSDVIVEHYGDILFKNGDVEGAVAQWNISKKMGNKSSILMKKIDQKNYVEE